MNDHLIGHTLFVGNVTRTFYLAAAGKQYVEGDDGERVLGVWVRPPAS
jgi:hypothetical protein